MLNIISDALAADSISNSTQQQGGGTSFLILMLFFVAITYFLLIRPQSKKAKLHAKLISELALNDEVSTAGGIVGIITEMDKQYVKLQIDCNSFMTMQRNSISLILPKGTVNFKDKKN